MDIPGLYEGLWFFGGALLYSWLTGVLGKSPANKVAEKIRLKAVEAFLEIHTNTILDLKFILGMKYKLLAETDYLKETEEISKQIDKKMMRDWASSSVLKLESVYPQMDRGASKELEKYLYKVIETEE